MEEKDIITIIKLNSLTRNVVANFIDDEDKFIKQQTIDHIIQNGKYYDVISISKARVKKIVENGLKYEQLKKENEELKNESNEFCKYNKKLRNENEDLKSALAEKDRLLENAIVPKFKVGELLWFIVDKKLIFSTNEWFYIYDNQGLQIEVNKLPNGYYFYNFTLDKAFTTKQEAKEAMKKLEEK